MSRRFLILSGTALLLTVSVLAAGCSSASDAGQTDVPGDAGAELTQTAEAGGVTIDATWLTADSLPDVDADLSAYPLDEFAAIEVAFTTHSGDLNEIAMDEAASLRTGTETVAPAAWLSVSDDSHHREGVLVFERQGEAGPVELALEIADGEAVSLEWQAVPGD